MSIHALPGDVVAQIKSSTVITSLNGVVYGLLQNALDAGASKVTISVDYSRGNCSVEDDGQGIPPADFRDDGGLGKLYYTSKYPPRLELHGRHGTFLASLAALSLLTVSSHHREYRSHNALTIHNSRVVARNTPALPEQELLAAPSGTRVVVRDLFGSMPVRVKQRAIEADRLGTAKNFDQLVLTIVSVLLAWPRVVMVTVRDGTRKPTLLRSAAQVDERESEKPVGKSIITRTRQLLAQASLAEDCNLESWVPLGVSAHGISVNGCVSLTPVATRRLQFISLGVRPFLNDHDSNVLHEAFNDVFASSAFGAVGDSGLDAAEPLPKLDNFNAKELKVRKGPDRWPVFYLRIELDGRIDSLDGDAFLEGGSDHDGSIEAITDLLRLLAYEFLKKHHFRPKPLNALQALQPTESESPGRQNVPKSTSTDPPRINNSRLAKRQRTTNNAQKDSRALRARVSSPFSSWSRIKAAPAGKSPESVCSSLVSPLTHQARPGLGDIDTSTDVAGSSSTWSPLFGQAGKLLRKPFDDGEETPAETGNVVVEEQTESPPVDAGAHPGDTILWTDPVTKIKTLVDQRTGFVIKPASKPTERRETPKVPTRAVLPQRPAGVTPLPCPPDSEGRIFQPSERAIPSVFPSSVPSDPSLLGSHQCGETGEVKVDAATGVTSKVLESRISKDALREAQVIGQVDRKFILARVSSTCSAGYMLVLIDQHAADERCKVEDLMRGYFATAGDGGDALTEPLERPLRFEFSRREGQLLTRFTEHFKHWGIGLDVFHSRDGPAPGHDKSTTIAVEVQSLPPCITERCRLEPRLLAELLRKEIWKLCDDPGRWNSGRDHTQEDARDWIARFHRCPDGIQELLNSRACRSAIMFNDVLTLEECKQLVRRLASCAFPFQCAHGRPSMVPLVDMGGESGLVGLMDEREVKPRETLRQLETWSKSTKMV
ncbi:hypothetical protein QBC47DRAFT_383898 [Echria macrotheca]|uniref:MutL C-terminal dimerisation domain-containing protein n=1 Tax=Echria macrotheca TaxID=438768 RepID=A0AAJ0BA00_9PEZI|nr:hypothetical protein QBC47DRAFT_383898 [Echria macrotheca]